MYQESYTLNDGQEVIISASVPYDTHKDVCDELDDISAKYAREMEAHAKSLKLISTLEAMQVCNNALVTNLECQVSNLSEQVVVLQTQLSRVRDQRDKLHNRPRLFTLFNKRRKQHA
ncbi:MAG: hypothetical protein ACPH5P_00085 [Akkermansiaceae bacterium]